jgi:hypothetical protein
MDQPEKRDYPNQSVSAERDPSDSFGLGQEGPALPSLLARILPLLFEPTKLFRALREQPVFWGAIFLVATLVAVSAVLIPSQLYVEAARRQLETSGQDISEIPEGMTANAGRFMKIMASAGAFVGIPIVVAIQAGILSLIFRFVLGYVGTYRQYISVIAHSFLVMALGSVLLTPLRIAAGRADLSLNLGAFTSNLGDGFFGRFLQGVDLLTLWVFALVGLGIAVVDGTRPARTAIGVTIGLVLIFSAAGAALRGLGGQ